MTSKLHYVLILSLLSSAWAKERVLFDGKSLKAFEYAPKSWEIEKDGSVVCRMAKTKDKKGKERIRGMGYLWTKEEFSDFELSVEYKLSPGANSGIFYRSDKDNPVNGGFEIQLMDNEGFCKGPEVSFHLNGKLAFKINLDDWKEVGNNPDGSANKFKVALKDLPRKGRIGFQNHGQVVWFRKILIKIP